ncbi:hypothetical protein MCUN1_001553 [Malassezia cuniculi]|uniref:ARID domain-containing protein n=1 Tax=Malassezia cuniculi TaxID=948313 RepID=A0AAF0J6M4_9BASI|nr:hypothetical protein MCUN1_001553 [Malassezia cuniculi]
MGRPMPMVGVPDMQYNQWMARQMDASQGMPTPTMQPATVPTPTMTAAVPGTPNGPGTPVMPGTPSIPPGTPVISANTANMSSAAPPNQTVPASGQRDFATVVQSFMLQRGLVLPNDWPAGFRAPAANNPAEIRTIDPATLFAKVTSVGGSERVFSVPGGWSYIAAQLDLAVGPPGEMSAPGAIPNPGEVPGRLAAYYTQRLSLFEQSWMATRRNAENNATAMAPPQPPKQPIVQVRQNESRTPTPAPTTPAEEDQTQAPAERPQMSIALQQQVAHLQQLVATEQITPQQAAARFAALQAQSVANAQSMQNYNAPANASSPPAVAAAQAASRSSQPPATPTTPAGSTAPAETEHKDANGIPTIPLLNVTPEQLRGNPSALQALQMLKNGSLNQVQQQVAVAIVRAALGQVEQAQMAQPQQAAVPMPSVPGAHTMPGTLPNAAQTLGAPNVPGSSGVPNVAATGVSAVPAATAIPGAGVQPAPQLPVQPAAEAVKPEPNAPPAPTASANQRATPAPEKFKIEYMPWCTEIHTFGGRDLNRIEDELSVHQASATRVRGVNELGTVDIYSLIMSLRSRLEYEVSYALNALLVLSAGVDASPTFQLQIAACDELLDELLVLLVESTVVPGTDAAEQLIDRPRSSEPPLAECGVLDESMVSYADAIALALQDESEMRIWRRKCGNSVDERAAERRAHIALTILSIFRNVALMMDNTDYLANHPRFLKVLADISRAAEKDPRVNSKQDDTESPLAHFTLRETLRIRKDILTIILGVSGESLSFEKHGALTIVSLLDVIRFFVLDASLIEERQGADVLLEPSSAGMRVNFQAYQAPYHAGVALQTLARFLLLETNRETLVGWLPARIIEQLVEHLVHLLPLSETDFRRLGSEPRLEYLEGAALCLYALVYLASPDLKTRFRMRSSVVGVMFGTVRHLLATSRDYERNPYSLLCRRLVETLRLLSDAQDMFDDPPLLGMYLPAQDAVTDNRGAGAAQAGVLVCHESVIFETLQQAHNVEHLVMDELLDLASVSG